MKIYLQMLADQRGGDTTAEDIYAEKAAETCVGYLPPSEEIAGAVVFFCSPLAKCVTGTALPVNGGHFIHRSPDPPALVPSHPHAIKFRRITPKSTTEKPAIFVGFL